MFLNVAILFLFLLSHFTISQEIDVEFCGPLVIFGMKAHNICTVKKIISLGCDSFRNYLPQFSITAICHICFSFNASHLIEIAFTDFEIFSFHDSAFLMIIVRTKLKTKYFWRYLGGGGS